MPYVLYLLNVNPPLNERQYKKIFCSFHRGMPFHSQRGIKEKSIIENPAGRLCYAIQVPIYATIKEIPGVSTRWTKGTFLALESFSFYRMV